MRILWGALRAVSVEMMGILVVLWMLHGVTGLAVDAPWWGSSKPVDEMSSQHDQPSALLAQAAPIADTSTAVARKDALQHEAQRATMGQWFSTLFPANPTKTSHQPEVEQRVEYTSDRLDHYSRLYGIASRN